MNDYSYLVESKSDQLNASDLIAGGKEIEVSHVVVLPRGSEQPMQIFYSGCDNKPFKPCLIMRKLLMNFWGNDFNSWGGRIISVYLDKSVSFGKAKNVGGVRIDGLSDIKSDAEITIQVARGKFSTFKVRRLEAYDPLPILRESAALGTDALKAAWVHIPAEYRADRWPGGCPIELKEAARSAGAVKLTEVL